MYLHLVDILENDVLSLARAMPEPGYDFAPRQGAFAGVRTFGEQVKHLATVIYMTSALVLSERSPYDPGTGDNGPDSVRGKEEILNYLEGSFAYARKALRSLTGEKHLERIETYFGAQTRGEVAAGIVYHSYNHYGQMVVYARMNGIVPPAEPG